MTGAADPLRAFRLDGRVAVVTGSTRGIGRAVVEGLAGVGARVAVNSRNAGAAEDVARGLRERGLDAIAVAADVSRPEDVRRLFETVEAALGPVDVLVSNAGVSPFYTRAEEMAEADWDQVIATNLKGAFLCCQAAARSMLPRGRGSIVIMSSIGGAAALPRLAAYCAAKGGLDQLTRVLAVEWSPRGVRVNAIAPTWVETDLARGIIEHPRLGQWVKDQTPMGRAATPDEIVGGALYLASDASAFVTGHILRIDGGWTAW